MSWIYGSKAPEPAKATFAEEILQTAVNDISEIVESVVPTIKEDLIKQIRISNLRENPDVKTMISRIELFAKSKLQEAASRVLTTISGPFVSVNPNAEDVDVEDEEVKIRKADILQKQTTVEQSMAKYKKIKSNKDVIFADMFHAARNYNYHLNNKNVIKIMNLGNTHVGKTTTIRYVFNIKNDLIPLKGNTESDTSDVTEYCIEQNGVKLISVDVPGWYDSRRRSHIFYQDILSYIKENGANSDIPIDVILWFAKLDDIIDETAQDIIQKLTNDIGPLFWKQTIIVLTHANSVIPGEYYYVEAMKCLETSKSEINEKNIELQAWSLYAEAKKQMWKRAFKKYNDDIPVVLVENNCFQNGKLKNKNNTGTLKDGTRIIKEFCESLLKVISVHKQAPTFIFLAGVVKDTQSQNLITQNYVPVRTNNTTAQPNIVQAQPAIIPAQPTIVPAQPIIVAAQPITVSVQPAIVPVQPIIVPVQPIAVPVQPTIDPVQPVAVPVQPIAVSAQPIAAPVQPTPAPVQPIAAPVQPIAAPVQPVIAPVQPVATPVQPTTEPDQTNNLTEHQEALQEVVKKRWYTCYLF